MKLRSFLIGLASGIVVCILVVMAMLLHEASKANKKVQLGELPALQFPDPSERSKFQPIDSNWLISDLNGHNVNFSSFRGKVIFLHFWATWCQPCQTEMPSIQRLQNKTQGYSSRVCISFARGSWHCSLLYEQIPLLAACLCDHHTTRIFLSRV